MTTWSYLATRLVGDGQTHFITADLPLQDVKIRSELSGPGGLSATIDPQWRGLVGPDGRPILESWGTAIWAEADGVIQGGGILYAQDFQDSKWSLDCTGFTGYAGGMPYTDSWFGVEIDVFDVVREIWSHLQRAPGGDLGLRVDQLKSGKLIGTEMTQDEYDSETGDVGPLEDGPIRLNWYSTEDLGGEIDKLAEETPFDYWEEHAWSADGSEIEHRLRLQTPRTGRRRRDLRFVLGENVQVVPTVAYDADEWANEILFLGAGEGRLMVRGDASERDNRRLRRVKVVTDKSIRGTKKANKRARVELSRAKILGDVKEISILDHPHAPLGSIRNGDEIRLMAETGWVDVDDWFRVTSTEVTPDDANVMRLTVERSEAAL